MIVFLIILFVLILVLAVSLWEYKKERDKTMRIIASIPFLALIISIFTNNNDNAKS